MDVLARLIAQQLAEAWKQPVLVDNRGGGGGTIGANAVAKAAPDGYAFLLTTSSLAVGPALYRKLPYDALKDFAPVTQISVVLMALVVNSQVPATSVGDLIALAKSQPGRLNVASSGMGAPSHFAASAMTRPLLPPSAPVPR